ncbi:MAG: hypothetical protein KAU28_03670, partial [Phycisphaerae bacterium]|nr:hypothetical protein [Phycisphaerae bacterium]
WDIEELVLVDVDGDGAAREAPMNEWPGSSWSVYDFEGGPPMLMGPDGDWGEAPFGLHTAGVTTDEDDLWVLDSQDSRICLIAKTDSGRALTARPAADTTRLKMTVARPDVIYNIPRLDDAALNSDWTDRGFRVDVFSQLNRGSPQFRADSIYTYRAMRTGLALAWNADGLLVNLQIGDDEAVEAETDQALWENNGDCILLYVAPQRGRKELRRVVIAPGLSDEHPDVRVLCNDSLTPPKNDQEETFHHVNASDESALRVKRTTTDGGYALDILVPWQDLDITPAAGDEIGVQMIVLDRDSANPDAPMAGAFWYPSLGARKNTLETHRLRLSDQASPAVAAAIDSGPNNGRYDIAVTASSDLAGQTVTVLDGDKTIAEAVLITDELSGYAVGSIPLPLPAPTSPLTQPRVMLTGECIGRLHPDRPTPDEETPIKLVRDGDSAMLTGMETMDWGGD